MLALSDRIMRRIKAHGRGTKVFGPADFFDMGNRAAIDQSMSRLTRGGKIRRVARGLYDWPRHSRILAKPAPVNLQSAIAAIAKRDAIRLLPAGMQAANDLGLTTAVPAKTSYCTDGRSRQLVIDGRTVDLKHVGTKRSAWAGRPGAPVIQALYWLGKDCVESDSRVRNILQRTLTHQVKQDLVRGLRTTALPAWMVSVLRIITAPDSNTYH